MPDINAVSSYECLAAGAWKPVVPPLVHALLLQYMDAPAKRQLLEAVLAGSTHSLERYIWDITLAQLQTGSCCYREALLDALDGSAFLNLTQRAELLRRFFALSQPRGQVPGSPEAKCFVGILLCFHSQRDDDPGLVKEGAKFLLSAYHQQCNLATLLLALCYECGKGVERSVESAVQCYTVAARQGYQLAQIFLKECLSAANPSSIPQQPAQA